MTTQRDTYTAANQRAWNASADFHRAGADWAPLITYITAWSILSMPRILIFEIPFVGGELASVRYLSTLILPPIAGLLARYITRVYRPPEGSRE